ncbi:MAG: hypothetical protein AUK55_11890 [Syntrophobacteraceae bacterium CG2_30_61_12]|nr:MAG: hypothetical protein AUK55_11890 [Syntrophobacteraceae bacterium CG2_30_61_12]PIU31895.1 MAG: hypothetical protein COT06_05660 [Syntrophobacteraceae bacterium CG07_land_8_20_14_0_80_61_8]
MKSDATKECKDCKDCELAVFCYSEPAGWIFRTKQQIREIEQRIAACARHQELKGAPPGREA